jgi:hypothetical protein
METPLPRRTIDMNTTAKAQHLPVDFFEADQPVPLQDMQVLTSEQPPEVVKKSVPRESQKKHKASDRDRTPMEIDSKFIGPTVAAALGTFVFCVLIAGSIIVFKPETKFIEYAWYILLGGLVGSLILVLTYMGKNLFGKLRADSAEVGSR